MWRMLTGGVRGPAVELLEHEADGDSGSAAGSRTTRSRRPAVTWTTTSAPRFRFRDGLIAEHRDEFGFHRWARQALGPPGLLLGWTPIVQGSVRKRARARLDEFMSG